MRDLYLRFADEGEWLALGLDRDPGVLEIDVIGILFTIRESEEDEEVPLPGWRVNVRCQDDRDLSALDPFVFFPAHPRRVWA